MIAILPDGSEVKNFSQCYDILDQPFGPGDLTWGVWPPTNGIVTYYQVHYASVTRDGDYLRFEFDSDVQFAYTDDVSKPLESIRQIYGDTQL